MPQNPPIVITRSDFGLLRHLAGHPRLAAELKRAVVIDSRCIAADIVTTCPHPTDKQLRSGVASKQEEKPFSKSPTKRAGTPTNSAEDRLFLAAATKKEPRLAASLRPETGDF
jgi:hypothetical protein